MIRSNKLRARIVEREMSVATVAERMGINKSTLYRKLKTGQFTIGEAQQLAEILGLSSSDINEIFFRGDAA